MLKQYSVDELKVGMHVKYEELDAIYGLWIYLDTYDEREGGRIICISDIRNTEDVRKALKLNDNGVSVFYQDPDICEDGVLFMTKDFIVAGCLVCDKDEKEVYIPNEEIRDVFKDVAKEIGWI